MIKTQQCMQCMDKARQRSLAHSAAAAADTLIALEIFAYNFVEIKRWQDFKKPGSQTEKGSFVGLEGFFQGSGENGYPGGIFDPLGLSKCVCNHCLHGLCPTRPWNGEELQYHRGSLLSVLRQHCCLT